MIKVRSKMRAKASQIPFSKVKALGNKLSVTRYLFLSRDIDPMAEVNQCYILGNTIHAIIHNSYTNEDMVFQRSISGFTSAKLIETGEIVTTYDKYGYADILSLNTKYSVNEESEQFGFVVFHSTGLVVAVDASEIGSTNFLDTKEFGPVLFISTDIGYCATGIMVTDKGEIYNISIYLDGGDTEINIFDIGYLHNKWSTYHGTKIDSYDEVEFLKKVK